MTGLPNYEDMDALDTELFNSNMNDLLAGRMVDLPEFDFIDGTKIFGRRITSIRPDQPIVNRGYTRAQQGPDPADKGRGKIQDIYKSFHTAEHRRA